MASSARATRMISSRFRLASASSPTMSCLIAMNTIVSIRRRSSPSSRAMHRASRAHYVQFIQTMGIKKDFGESIQGVVFSGAVTIMARA